MAENYQVQDRIHDALERVLDEREKGQRLFSPIEHMLEMGGKRLRPSLVILACRMMDGDEENALHPAIGLELFHNFTLMHDDLMDEAPLRRGKETVHEKFGKNTAILSGDAMFVKAYQELCKAEGSILPDILREFNQVALEVCIGQQKDMEFEERDDVGTNEYLEMIEAKTAALLGACLAIGGITAKAPPEAVDVLRDVGRKMGVAFQLQDDLMDVYADQAKFGKQVGGDILSDKKTYLLLRAYQVADQDRRNELDQAFLTKDLSPEDKVDRVRRVYDQLDIKGETEERITSYFQEAFGELDQLDIEKEKKKPLVEFFKRLTNRDS